MSHLQQSKRPQEEETIKKCLSVALVEELTDRNVSISPKQGMLPSSLLSHQVLASDLNFPYKSSPKCSRGNKLIRDMAVACIFAQ